MVWITNSFTALVLDGSGWIPLAEMRCPRYKTLLESKYTFPWMQLQPNPLQSGRRSRGDLDAPQCNT